MATRRPRSNGRALGLACLVLIPLMVLGSETPGRPASERLEAVAPESETLRGGQEWVRSLDGLRSGETYRIQVALRSGTLARGDRVQVELIGPDGEKRSKTLHEGDPDVYLSYRPSKDGTGRLVVRSEDGAREIPVLVEWDRQDLGADDASAIEAEPNDDWRHANTLVLGRDVYGTADDVDYLENTEEGKSGLDWFRLVVTDEEPILVYFQLDLLDRDVSANIRVSTVDDAGAVQPYVEGKDPMEIVHDRERERYSKHVSRVFKKGTYYIEINANHPSYILRTRKLPVPPYDDPKQAVEAGMHYIMNVGDAWFAQVPREGNIYVRADNIHDTGTRCTACHPAVFSTESNLVAHRNGYPIRSKSNFQYVVDRIYNSITPLYGPDGLYWQRFIAIPLQAQGKQGGIVMDFEREVSGRETSTFRRFGPFLRAAWADREDLPEDEKNGVVPLDSKFGFAWRDWRVLTEMARRTGDPSYHKAAARIAELVGEPAADTRVETLQDRIHRIYTWWLVDLEAHSGPIHDESEAILALQNEDGGWHEVDRSKGPSAVYTTGQIVWTLLELGYTREDPRIAKALRYLLSQQQPFGGWIQTTTHENFRTPMRETRYAVEALAEAFPNGPARTSWGNRDEKPARLPRTDSLIHTLDDLENLWDVAEADRPGFAAAIIPLLEHKEPLVRAYAAACLGRLEREEAVHPLIERLKDPSKIVWRAAAWALRRLGNAGLGSDAIGLALESAEPLTRRGATRIFAYQFHGMDERLDLAYRLINLTDDPDLWTRLQALKTLRQWFYRTADANLQRRIVYAYLARMRADEHPVIRKNLSEGMYIMLDENLGGGVSLHKNIGELPERLRPGILAARAEFERQVLLTPVLSALESGNARQREAILRSFDGTFFKGRFYARRPTNMLDVGNDREFGFLYEPPTDVLDRTFEAVFQAEASPEVRRQSILLASFFLVPGRTSSPVVQSALLKGLTDPDESVREAARKVVGEELSIEGIERDPDRFLNLLELLRNSKEGQGAVLRAIGRQPSLVDRVEVRDALKEMLGRDDAATLLQPVLRLPVFTDTEVLEVLTRGWERSREVNERLALLDVLFARRSLINVKEPPEPALDILRDAVHDRSAAVREKTLNVVSNLDVLWAGKVSNTLLLSALTDDTPALRRLGLTLADTKLNFWTRADAKEVLLRLLVDPDAKVREAALSRVERERLIEGSPALARRVKVVAGDPALRGRAEAALRSQGFDPSTLIGDVSLSRPRLLNLSTFRERVNPIFYQQGEDGYSCSRCHANHTILRIAEADPSKGFTGEQLMTNYNSVLKVINLGEPESSLILRKPRSPQGQGGADPSSPTGLTHVGGPRWESAEHPAYQALLDWIREASSEVATDQNNIRLSADSYAPDDPPGHAADGDVSTYWQTEFVGASPGYPHELVVDLGTERKVDGLVYVPRQDSPIGRVKAFEVRLSDDGEHWSAIVANGEWDNDPTYKFVSLPGKTARYVRLRGLSEVNGQPFMSAAELVVDSSPADPAKASAP